MPKNYKISKHKKHQHLQTNKLLRTT